MANDNTTPGKLLLEYSCGACDDCRRPGEWAAVESVGLMRTSQAARIGTPSLGTVSRRRPAGRQDHRDVFPWCG